MARLRDFAGRFRPAGVPGAAAPAGVPADLRAARKAELEPVFAALAEVIRQCAELRRQAVQDAGDTAGEARERSESILATARSRSAAERAEAFAHARQEDLAAIAATLGQARRTAGALRARAAHRLPALVERVVDRVRALGSEP